MEKKMLRRIGLTKMCMVLLSLVSLSGCSPSSGSDPWYTVSFECNGGTEIEAVEVPEGDTITAPADPVKEKHEFIGWYEDKDLSEMWDFDSDAVISDMTLYAKWQEMPEVYTVSFECNGGSEIDPVLVRDGQTIRSPAAPAKAKHEFAGWYEDEALTDIWDFNSDVVTRDMTLYAKWVPMYTVTFNTNGGPSSINSQTVVSGGKVTFPGAPGRDGYGFAGWFTDNNTFLEDWDFSNDTVTQDMTLYVKWRLHVWIIDYRLNGGTLTGETTSYTIESSDITLAEPVKSGFVFDGWYEDSGFSGEPVTMIPAGSFGYREYYAKWIDE